jgi:uncharacterized membrane protein YciS (DUF1049 family)
MNKKVTSALTSAIMISLLLIVLDLIAGFSNIKFATWYRWIPTIVFCVAIIIVCITYANQKDNVVTFGNVFGHGFKTSAIIAGLMLIYTLLSIYVIFPDTKEKYIDEMRRQMEAKGNMSEDTINNAVEMTSKFFLVGATIGAIIGTLIGGAIASLLGAAFAKKKPASPFDQQTT